MKFKNDLLFWQWSILFHCKISFITTFYNPNLKDLAKKHICHKQIPANISLLDFNYQFRLWTVWGFQLLWWPHVWKWHTGRKTGVNYLSKSKKKIFLYYVLHLTDSLSTTFGKIQNLDSDESPSVNTHTHSVPITAGPVGCLWRRWLGPPAGSWPAVPASAWWWCRLSAPGRRCCPSAGLGDTDAGPLWLWGRNTTHYNPVDSSVNNILLYRRHLLMCAGSEWQREVNLLKVCTSLPTVC